MDYSKKKPETVKGYVGKAKEAVFLFMSRGQQSRCRTSPATPITASMAMIIMFLATALHAQDAASGQNEVLLTVSGDVATAAAQTFDLDMLMALPETTIWTSTIWTEGVHRFTGVALSDLMDVLGVDGGTLLATAINDYTVAIPVNEALAGGPIIAYLMDGARMSIRDKGPLWIIYPYDSSAKYRSEVVYARSIWQLERIEVER